MEGYRTATLDLKRRNRSSVPYADTEDDVRIDAICALRLGLCPRPVFWRPSVIGHY